MSTLNLKSVASAVAALALTLMMSWTFVDATSLANLQRQSHHGFLAAVSALVR
ncbi:MAG: hypothetical protein ABI769_03450 [Pseudomonadota bacterium]